MDVSAFSNIAQPAEAVFARDDREINTLKAMADKSPEETGKRFEELFTTMLVKEFRKTLPEGFFGSGPGADTYEGWLDEHLGKALADQDTLGIVGLVKAKAAVNAHTPITSLAPTTALGAEGPANTEPQSFPTFRGAPGANPVSQELSPNGQDR